MKTMRHMKKKGTYKAGKGMGQVIALAKKSFHRRGGADDEMKEEMPMPEPSPMPAEEPMEAGRRRRSGKKTRRHSRRR
jgi:hypothetical protein